MSLIGPPLDGAVDIVDLIAKGLHRSPEETALVCAKTRWTWEQLDSAANRLAGNLLALGLEPGERLATLMPNRVALLVLYLACFRAGLVVTPLNYRYTSREIDHALEVSDAGLLFSHIDREADWAASRRVGQLRRGIVTYGGPLGAGTRYEDLVEKEPPPVSFPTRDPSEPAAIFFTSGSTGPAKGVTHTVASIGWMLAGAAAAFELTPDDVVLPGSSMSHLGSFVWALAGLAAGVRVVVARTFDAHEILPLLQTERPTVVCMIPAALLRLVREHDATHDDFASIRLFRCGSDKVPAELEAEFERLTGHKIDEGYGMTEVGLATLNPPSGLIKSGSVGRPVPGFALVVRGENGVDVPIDAPGQLFMKTPSLTAGYWNDPAATAEAISDGWINSADVMKVDEDGYLWFCGRKKQIIVHDGSNIFPQEVEDALLEHPVVENAAVIGIHDLLHGEIVRAYVALREGAAPVTSSELIAFARERIGYKAPEEIVFLDEIPLNPTGKVDRVALKKQASAHH